MTSLDALRREINDLWLSELPGATRVCVTLVDFLERTPADELQLLTFSSLKSIAKKDEVDEELLAAISLLTNTEFHLLESRLLFVDDDDREFEIDKDEFAEARETGELEHPETGAMVKNFLEKIFIFFEASSELIELKAPRK